jgi:hypothetical protein
MQSREDENMGGCKKKGIDAGKQSQRSFDIYVKVRIPQNPL